ncbi:unnamed protein product, partial [Mesorhabditis spiculigera]
MEKPRQFMAIGFKRREKETEQEPEKEKETIAVGAHNQRFRRHSPPNFTREARGVDAEYTREHPQSTSLPRAAARAPQSVSPLGAAHRDLSGSMMVNIRVRQSRPKNLLLADHGVGCSF